MSTTIRCPNPACPQVFLASSLVPGTRYQCPACGTQFAYQMPAAPPPPPAAPSVEPPAAPGQSPSPSRPESSLPAATGADRYKPALIAMVAILLVGFVVLAAFRLFEQSRQAKPDKVVASNYQVAKQEGLKRDEELEREAQADLAYHDQPTESAVLFASRDFQTRLPTGRELIDGALEKLRKKFPEKVEYEKRPEADETIDGIPFSAYEFAARAADGSDVAGEFLVGASRGYGYYLASWGNQAGKEAAQARLKEIRQGFSQLDQRADWKAEALQLQLVEGKGWQLRMDARVWSPQEIPAELKETHTKAVTRIEGKIPGRKFYAGEMAEAYVFALDGEGDLKAAVAQAREYLLNLEKPVDDTKIGLELASSQDGEEIDRKVESQGAPQVQQLLRLISGGETQKLFLIQVGLFQKKPIFLAVSCPVKVRKLWEEEMLRLADGLSIERP